MRSVNPDIIDQLKTEQIKPFLLLSMEFNAPLIASADDREFNYDTGWWTKSENGVVIANGKATTTQTAGVASGVYRDSLLEVGEEYRITYTMSGYTSGVAGISINTTTNPNKFPNKNGTHTLVFTHDGSQPGRLYLVSDQPGVSFDDIHIIKEGFPEYLFTKCQVPLNLHNFLYKPRSFEVQNIMYSTTSVVDKLSLRLDNTDDIFTPLFVGGDPQGVAVVLHLVVLDENNKPAGGDSTALFYGEIDDWDMQEGEINIGIVNAHSRWPKKKTARHPSSCRWSAFKDEDCKYVGSDTTCDRSYKDCFSKGNQLNFGGFRFLPSIENKEVWWGRA